jgi:hypothetical protein
LKSLYDPTYLDQSWIGQDVGQPVNLIPRLKAWIASRLPGTKIAITEYNWGDGTTSSALAQALAIFGREGWTWRPAAASNLYHSTTALTQGRSGGTGPLSHAVSRKRPGHSVHS